MKKKLIVIVALLTMVLVLAGCSKNEMSLLVEEDGKSMTATFNKAKPGNFAMSGSLTVEEGDSVKFESALEGDGKVTFKMIGGIEADADADAEDLAAISEQDPAAEISVSGSDTAECTMPAGDYYVYVTVDKKATGTINITVQGSDQIPNPWSDVASGEEAAAGAGLDRFVVPEGAEINLGEIKVDKYRCMDGVAEAVVEFPAVEMTIRKGLSSSPDDDISGDYNTYEHEWTQNIKGLEVKCYGNREGEATKTIWTIEEYTYSITAYGLGGDDDYGLLPDDLNSIINGLL